MNTLKKFLNWRNLIAFVVAFLVMDCWERYIGKTYTDGLVAMVVSAFLIRIILAIRVQRNTNREEEDGC